MELDKSTQEAYDKLRETLEFSDDVDLCQVLSNANTRINRLTEELAGTYNSKEPEERRSLAIGPCSIRKLAVMALNNSDGLDKRAFEILSIMLVQSDNADLLMHVDVTDDVAYIGEDFAEEELERIERQDKFEGVFEDGTR